jgi:hypothetical protein
MRHLIALGVGALILTSPANAQQQAPCIKADVLDAALASIQEAASVEMVDGAGSTIRIYANVESGRWHLFVIANGSPDACLAAAGGKYTRYPSRTGRGA